MSNMSNMSNKSNKSSASLSSSDRAIEEYVPNNEARQESEASAEHKHQVLSVISSRDVMPEAFIEKRNSHGQKAMEEKVEQIVKEKKPDAWSTIQAFMAKGKIISVLMQSYVTLFLIFIAVLSLYWATFYRRETRYKNMRILVVNEDDSFIASDGQLQAGLIGNTFIDMVTNNSTLNTLAGWTIVPIAQFQQQAQSNNRSIADEIKYLVHVQNYWSGFQIQQNSTQLIYNMLSTANATVAESGALFQLLTVFYESGRHYSALGQYLTRHLYIAEQTWISDYVTPNIYNVLTSSLNSTQKSNLFSSPIASTCLSTLPIFNFVDERPATSTVVLGPSELGLLYAQVFSFHQFNFSIEIFQLLRSKLKYKSYVVCRVLSSQLNCLVLALAYCLITLAFQVPTNVAFGRSGFLVFWMFMYLYMAASAGINEIVLSVILAYDNKLLIAPWMIINLIVNMSPAFAPFDLLPLVFRYGYAMPMYCVHEILKVVFFDTWKGHLGQNIGILVAWIIVTNIIVVYNINWSTRRSQRRARKELFEKEKELKKEKIKEKMDTKRGKYQDHEVESSVGN